ncbi:uncharacterized protein Hap1MRO34_013072 isoform 2-T2 [Clarias gariepinus]
MKRSREILILGFVLIMVHYSDAMSVPDTHSEGCCSEFYTGSIPPQNILEVKTTPWHCSEQGYIVTTHSHTTLCVQDITVKESGDTRMRHLRTSRDTKWFSERCSQNVWPRTSKDNEQVRKPTTAEPGTTSNDHKPAIKDHLKTDSPVKDNLKTDSPVNDHLKTDSPVKDNLKTDSPVNDDLKGDSLIKDNLETYCL